MNLKKIFALSTMAITMLTATADDRIPAFPGAEGYGKWATGGRGGKTYVVTSLEDCAENDLKEGTFRWAVKQPGKKIVTFKVNGTIYLTSALNMDCGDLTILGQTAPGDGICLADYPVTISCENAIIRYLRFRLGQRQVEHHEGDGFGINDANNFIIDHCSVSWSIDECLSVSHATNGTIQWCVVSQALNDAGHTKGAHGYGGNWGGTNVTFSHNLIAQCTSRVPRLGGDTYAETEDFCDLRNNVFYNWGGEGCYGAEAIDVNFVANYYKVGPCTNQRKEGIQKRICAPGIRTSDYFNIESFKHDLDKWGHFYVEGNVNSKHSDVTADNWTIGILNQVSGNLDGTWTDVTKDTIHLLQPREFMSVTTHTADKTYEMVCKYAGASFYRDCLDSMIVRQVENGWGAYKSGTNGAVWGQIDKQTDNITNGQLNTSQVENGAWPILKAQNVGFTDSDGDGIDDTAEDNWNLDSSDPTDGAKLYTGSIARYKGYSYVEIFNHLANKKRREWNAAGYEDGTIQGTDDPTILCLRRLPWEHEISELTYKGYDKKTRQLLFADGLVITNQSGSIAGAVDQTIKLRGQQYTITVPATIKAKSIRIYGYANYENDIIITEVNGKQYNNKEYVITGAGKKKQTLVIPFDEEVSGKNLTITLSGDNQPCLKFYLVEEEISGISDNTVKKNLHNNKVYNLQGRLVENPTKGLFIINGKKVVLR